MRPHMKMNRLFKLGWISACWAVCISPPAFGQEPAAGRMKEVTEAVAQAVPARDLRAWVSCEIQSAFWGGYDVEVRLSPNAAVDGRGRLFAVSGGRFRVSKPVGLSHSLMVVTANRKGEVILGSQEEAFSKGVPFFISDVNLDSPTLVRFTVTSNPQVRLSKVAGRIEEIGPSSRMSIVNTPKKFSSASKPQNKTFSLSSPLNEQRRTFLSVVQLISDHTYCLVSNEVDLTQFAKAAPNTKQP